ncbi:MAG: hypothetical protein GY791_03510 [Alphaproteobacteria bacterium]|nr:hypothetical protein [Alphaproteobacteria bacterium]
MVRRAILPLIASMLAWQLPAAADDRHYEVDEKVSFHLSKPGGHLDYPMRLPAPGLLAFETDPETLKKVAVEVLDADGMVIGRGGARISTAGPYVVRLRRDARYDADQGFDQWDGHGGGALAFWSPDIDAFEPNDSRETAFVFELGPERSSGGGPVTLFPADDADHFVLRLTAPGYVTPTLRIPAFVDPALRYRLIPADEDGAAWQFGETRLLDEGDVALTLHGDVPQPAPVELRFDYAPNWDQCEPNHEAATACDLSDGRTVAISLYPAADVDWFSYKTDRPGAILLSLSGLPTPVYDGQGNLVRGLETVVRSVEVPEDSGRSAQYHVTHGTIFIGAPDPGVYRFALSGRWIGSNPVRAMELNAQTVESAIADTEPDFAIFGVYGAALDDGSIFELTFLAGLGAGSFNATAEAADIAAAMSATLGLPDEPEPRVTATDPDPETEIEKKRQVGGETEVAEKEGASVEASAASPQQAAVPPTPEEVELARLLDLESLLKSSSETTLWRHHYVQPDGEIVKRLEATKTPALAGEAEVTKSEALSPKMSRRLLARAIQDIE